METFKPSKEESDIKRSKIHLKDFIKSVVTQEGIVTQRVYIDKNNTEHEMRFGKYLGVEYGENKGGGECLIGVGQMKDLQKMLTAVQQRPGSKAYFMGTVTMITKPADGRNEIINTDAVDGFPHIDLTKEQIERYKNNPQLMLKISPLDMLGLTKVSKTEPSQSGGMALS